MRMWIRECVYAQRCVCVCQCVCVCVCVLQLLQLLFWMLLLVLVLCGVVSLSAHYAIWRAH